MAKIKNGMSRMLRIQAPRKGASPVILSLSKPLTGVVTIPPFGEAEVPFWDEVKNHPVYQSLLERGKIAVGNDEPDGEPHFTSTGDTLKAPERLDPEAIKDEAKAEKVKNLAYENEPTITTKRKPGRKPKAETESESEGEQP